MALDAEKVLGLMREYKHTNVFYLGRKTLSSTDIKRLDQSENGQMTDIVSQNDETATWKSFDTAKHDKENLGINMYENKPQRFFELYFYKIKIAYSGETFCDTFTLERDALSSDFFELYLQEFLKTFLGSYFVTYNESQSKITRNQTFNNKSGF